MELGSVTATVDAAVAELVADGQTPGMAVSIVRGGQPAWSRGYGVADPLTGRPATSGTLFRIASVTKPFTATVVLQLRDERRLALHDPLVAHLPEARSIEDPYRALERVTIGDVLLHVAGLQADAPMDDPRSGPGLTQPDLLARLGHARLVRPPGTRWHYSNLGYELLAILVARLSGEPYAERLTRAALRPAGLRDTTFHPTVRLADRLAAGVLPGGAAGRWDRAPDHDSDTLLGDGGLWSTADDLARWLAANCRIADADRRGEGGRILDGPTLRELHRPMVLVDLDGWRSAQGLGWASFRVDEAVWQGHTGSIAGFRSIALVRPADGLGVVALTNGPVRPNPVAHAAARALLAERPDPSAGGTRPADPQPGPAAAPRPIPEPGLARLTGTWVDRALGRQARTHIERGRLVLVQEGTPPADLVPTDDPAAWRIGGDGGAAGELVRFAGDVLNLAGWPYQRERERGG